MSTCRGCGASWAPCTAWGRGGAWATASCLGMAHEVAVAPGAHGRGGDDPGHRGPGRAAVIAAATHPGGGDRGLHARADAGGGTRALRGLARVLDGEGRAP